MYQRHVVMSHLRHAVPHAANRLPWTGVPVTTPPSWATKFVKHPVRPVEGMDPLATYGASQVLGSAPATGEVRPSIGYACLWEPVPERTWSGSAWNLREEMRLIADVVDIGIDLSPMTRTVLKAIHTRHRYGRFTTSWCTSRLTDAHNARTLRRGVDRNFGKRGCDTILMIDTLAVMPEPYFVYYDSSWDSLLGSVDGLETYAMLRWITPSNVMRRRDQQLAVFERAAGVVAMSHFLARSLIEQSGVPAEKVHVVHPGFSAGRTVNRSSRPLRERAAPRRKLLYVGRQYEISDFYRKGGDLVVAALGILRRDYDPQLTLTMVGMAEWPLPGTPPEGVDFRGILTPAEVGALYNDHDLFVMPSRAEPFGVVFAEALSRGMPCVARNTWAMPEIVTPGVSGALISEDDPHELAAAIASVLADDDLYKQCHSRALDMAQYFSWGRAAREMTQLIARETGQAPAL